MKKIFSHPLFYCVFAVLGLAGMGLQFWFFGNAPDAAGLLAVRHPATILTLLLGLLAVVLTVLSEPHIQAPRYPVMVRAIGAAAAAVFTAAAAWVMLRHQNHLAGILAALAAVGSVYILVMRLRKGKIHYWVYGLFALCFMFYLISRYQIWSAEPETAKYVYELLALVCMMLVFYQKAALIAHVGKFKTYHFFRCMALFLTFTAVPGSTAPTLYLTAAVLLLLDPSHRPAKKTKADAGSEAP